MGDSGGESSSTCCGVMPSVGNEEAGTSGVGGVTKFVNSSACLGVSLSHCTRAFAISSILCFLVLSIEDSMRTLFAEDVLDLPAFSKAKTASDPSSSKVSLLLQMLLVLLSPLQTSAA